MAASRRPSSATNLYGARWMRANKRACWRRKQSPGPASGALVERSIISARAAGWLAGRPANANDELAAFVARKLSRRKPLGATQAQQSADAPPATISLHCVGSAARTRAERRRRRVARLSARVSARANRSASSAGAHASRAQPSDWRAPSWACQLGRVARARQGGGGDSAGRGLGRAVAQPAAQVLDMVHLPRRAEASSSLQQGRTAPLSNCCLFPPSRLPSFVPIALPCCVRVALRNGRSKLTRMQNQFREALRTVCDKVAPSCAPARLVSRPFQLARLSAPKTSNTATTTTTQETKDYKVPESAWRRLHLFVLA